MTAMFPVLASAGATGPDDAQIAAKHARLKDAAQQFEAMFLQEMLKPANSLGRSEGHEDDAGEGDQNGTMQSLGTESMAKAIAAAGGLGIARHVMAEVERQESRREGQAKVQTGLKS